jgi:hypothetical protein
MIDELSWSAAGEWLAGFVPEGPLRTAVLLVYGLCVAVAPFIYKYYLGVLAQGAQPEGSIERQDYDKLRASLTGGNLAARLYAKWLTAFLDWIERFFGDAGMADRTLFPRAFGLKTPAPLWTAPAFDRCLLLALLYPFATIFVIWAISGHVGPAESALGLRPEVRGWSRVLLAAAIGFSSFAFWRGARARGWKSRFWIAAAFAGAGAFAFAGAVAGDSAFVTWFNDPIVNNGGPDTISGTFIIADSVGVTGAFAVAFADTSMGPFAVAVIVAVIVIVVAVAFVVIGFSKDVVDDYPDLTFAAIDFAAATASAAAAFAVAFAVAIALAAFKRRWHGFFLSLLLPAMILACFAATAFLSHTPSWLNVGPLLLFLVLLTLLNAPFDWASLGLTRALIAAWA